MHRFTLWRLAVLALLIGSVLSAGIGGASGISPAHAAQFATASPQCIRSLQGTISYSKTYALQVDDAASRMTQQDAQTQTWAVSGAATGGDPCKEMPWQNRVRINAMWNGRGTNSESSWNGGGRDACPEDDTSQTTGQYDFSSKAFIYLNQRADALGDRVYDLTILPPVLPAQDIVTSHTSSTIKDCATSKTSTSTQTYAFVPDSVGEIHSRPGATSPFVLSDTQRQRTVYPIRINLSIVDQD
jgi:hypothetical protein